MNCRKNISIISKIVGLIITITIPSYPKIAINYAVFI